MDSNPMIADASKSTGVAGDSLSPPSSAIAIFYKIIFRENSPLPSVASNSIATPAIRSTAEPGSVTGPSALPTEILMLIFQFVFERCVDWQPHNTGTFKREHTTVWLEDDPLSPSLFPYSLASVCARWLHILCSIGVYWTRHVVLIDPHMRATSLFSIQTLLQYVGNLPLQLIITRHPDAYAKADKDEHAWVRAALNLLQPHIHQIWSLTLDVKYSSSPSALWRDQADMQSLSISTPLSSHSNASGLARLPGLYTAMNGHGFSIPDQASLTEEITIGGYPFNHLFEEQHNRWFRNITFLTIRGYTTSDGSGISLRKFINAIQACALLQKLTVEDITFINDVRPLHRFHIEVPVVFLRNISGGDAVGSILSQTLGIRPKEVVTISGCPFHGFGKRSSFRTRVSSISLVLEGMNASAVAIQQLVCFWNGENLSLINCPGVSASFLRGVPTDEMPPDLRRLRIADCENASAAGLITLVKSRELQSVIDGLVPGGPDEEPCMALVELDVHGRGPPITTEEAAWLAGHVETFTWNTIAIDGMQYTWDKSTRELIVFPM